MGSPEKTGPAGEQTVVLPISTSGQDADANDQPDGGGNGDLERTTSAVTLRNLESTWKGWICVLGSFLFLVPSFGEFIS
jgi:hypothetical protein